MTLVKDGTVSADAWTNLDDGEAINGSQAVIVTYNRWRAAGAGLAAHNGPLGLRMKSEQPPALIEEHMGRFDLIDIHTLNELFLLTQPAHLQKMVGRLLEGRERAIARADYLRKRLGN